MFGFKKSKIDQEIERLISQLEKKEGSDPQYEIIANNLKVLYDSRNLMGPHSFSMDTVILVIGNIAGLLLVLNYEAIGNVISTKALSLVLKGRV